MPESRRISSRKRADANFNSTLPRIGAFEDRPKRLASVCEDRYSVSRQPNWPKKAAAFAGAKRNEIHSNRVWACNGCKKCAH